MIVNRSFMARLLGSDLYVSSAAILVATGGLVICVSFLGCIGAFKEIKCLLLTVSSFTITLHYITASLIILFSITLDNRVGVFRAIECIAYLKHTNTVDTSAARRQRNLLRSAAL